MRGGREMEDHFECLWDLFRSIPSLEVPNASVLDEYYWLNKHDPNYSLCRATEKRGEDAHTDCMTSLLKISLMMKYLALISGCTGALCLLLKTGTVPWR